MFNQYGYPMYPQQQNPYQQRYDIMSQRQPCQIVQVNGRSGAESYQLAANSSILLLDESAPIVWFKRTDGAGYATIEPYNITPYAPEAPIDPKSLEERISRLEEIINEKSNTGSAE